MSKSAKKVTLEQLKLLAEEGKTVELQTALSQCLFNDLRGFLNALGIKVRTKQYEEIRTKEDHVQLLCASLMKQAKGAAHTEIDIAAKKPLTATQCEVAAVDMGELLVTNSSMDAERVHLVHCINFVTFALMNAENRKENVLGLKRTLATELTHYVKRLKRIQDDDN